MLLWNSPGIVRTGVASIGLYTVHFVCKTRGGMVSIRSRKGTGKRK